MLTTTGAYRQDGTPLILTVGPQEHSSLIEINSSDKTCAVTFAGNGEYLLSGGFKRVQIWRVQDGKRMATMDARNVRCLVVSEDGR